MTYAEVGALFAKKLAEAMGPVQPMWGYTDWRCLLATSFDSVDARLMGPPHPSWCPVLWGDAWT